MAAAKLTAQFWNKNKDLTVTGKELSGALAAYEKRRKTAEASESKHDWEQVPDLLEAIESAASKTRGKCNKTLHKKTLGLLDEMMKLVELEEKTARHMIALAGASDGLDGKFKRASEIVKVLKPHATTAEKVVRAVEKLQPQMRSMIQEKDLPGIRKAIEQITGLQNTIKAPMKAAENAEFQLKMVEKLPGNLPKDLAARKKQVETLAVAGRKQYDAIRGAHGAVEDVKGWFEGELVKMKR